MAGGRLLSRLLRPALAVTALASPAIADPAIWKVSDGDSSIHLFGSVHMFPREIDWRTPLFDELLAAADKVVFEVVMDADAYAAVTQVGFTKGRLTGGEKLSDVLAEADYQRLSSAAGLLGINMATLDVLQPWLVTMTLMQTSSPKMIGGVELQIDGEIPLERKFGLETAEEQMGFLADAPLEEQIALLMSTVDAVGAGSPLNLEPLVGAWLRGDVDTLHQTIESQVKPAEQATYDRLLRQRNERWIAPLETMLAENAENLVVVGAAHLIGGDSVTAMLEAKGYEVERLDGLSDADDGVVPGALGRATTKR